MGSGDGSKEGNITDEPAEEIVERDDTATAMNSSANTKTKENLKAEEESSRDITPDVLPDITPVIEKTEIPQTKTDNDTKKHEIKEVDTKETKETTPKKKRTKIKVEIEPVQVDAPPIPEAVSEAFKADRSLFLQFQELQLQIEQERLQRREVEISIQRTSAQLARVISKFEGRKKAHRRIVQSLQS